MQRSSFCFHSAVRKSLKKFDDRVLINIFYKKVNFNLKAKGSEILSEILLYLRERSIEQGWTIKSFDVPSKGHSSRVYNEGQSRPYVMSTLSTNTIDMNQYH